MNVTVVDWLILAFFLLAFLGLALFLSSYARSVADYLVAGRKVRMWLGMGAGIAGEVGLVSIAAACEQGYMRGFSFVLIGILTMCILAPLFGVFGFGIERFRATKAMSVPQYLEMRFSKNLRLLSGYTNSFAGVIQMCIFPIVGARFVRVLVGAPEWVEVGGVSLQSAWLIMLVLLCCNVVFTYFGGYITLIVMNFFVMILIVGTFYWLVFDLVGGLGVPGLWSELEREKGLAGVYPFAEDREAYGVTYFAWLLMMSILLQFSYGPYLQKYASMDKPKTVSRSYMLGLLFGNGRTFVILALGVTALVVLGSGAPEDIEASKTAWARMATPYYLGSVIGPGVMGILLAALLFADISTTNQYLLSWSTSIVNDCISPLKKTPFSTERHITAVRLTIVGLCVLFFFFGVTYRPTLPIWDYLWLLANVIGGTGIAVLFGMYWRRTTTSGAYAAVFICLVLPICHLVAEEVHERVWPGQDFPLSSQATGLYSYLLAMATLIVVSLISKEKSKYWDLGKTAREMNVSGP